MAEYGVSLPITGIAYVSVEADNEEEAIEKAIQFDITIENVEEWTAHEKIVEGNVFYGMLNDAEADLV